MPVSHLPTLRALGRAAVLGLATTLATLSLAPSGAYAAGDASVADYTELGAATSGCAGTPVSPSVIIVTADISDVGGIVVDCPVVLDLASFDVELATIQVLTGGALTVRSTGGTGTLTVDASAGSTAGLDNSDGTDITIQSGTVDATGGLEAAGIGGSGAAQIGDITISGGDVTAYGGDAAAGIGAGLDGDTADIMMSGGTVWAAGGSGGAGIGGGATSDPFADAVESTVVISGGTVDARGGFFGAGVGAGAGPSSADVRVEGGTVTAEGGVLAAGIGSSILGTDLAVAVAGGTVNTGGGPGGPGIGSGAETTGTTDIEISAGDVTATGGDEGPGIGTTATSALPVPTSTVDVSGGTVTATGGIESAGIGGGPDQRGSAVTISGGTVTAMADVDGTAVGAGFGCGCGGSADFGTLRVTGGTLRLPAGPMDVPDTDPGAEVTVGPDGLIDGSADPVPTYADVTGDGQVVNNGRILLPAASLTSDAVAVSNHHYLVTFDTDGGSAAPGPVTVFADTFTRGGRAFPPDPTKAGFVFGGWFTAPNGGGTSVTATSTLPGSSDGSGPLPLELHAHWALPTISGFDATIAGAPQVGQSLTAVTSLDGDATVDLAFQWQRSTDVGDFTNIPGATARTLVPTTQHVGRRIRLVTVASRAGYQPNTELVVTDTVVAPGTGLPAPQPTITGTANVGRTLTAAHGDPGESTVGYQWQRIGADGIATDIPGATAATYAVGVEDAEALLRVVVTYTAEGYEPATGSAASDRVVPGALALLSPRIAGTARVGKRLTAQIFVSGAFPGPVAGLVLRYRWTANDKVLGATGTTLRVPHSALGKRIRVRITATAPGHTTSSIRVAASRLVRPAR
ncbi:hypothetical protein NSZ01_25370 [Nocardioides szechwanensis]|uniref:Listeria/Bacterioides repeat-containing protein n=1 Tax=Nocardioides szechwanensis TaxID=1005944 RepID=A0A1H0AS28_9ACTN|nr:InlB B-repeat-containing protein [Nocardioides szechwanensis]GEP34769.1 hypothetical protein NSZ01_25370 [Nocardioides szechwanensis]SDN36332.1 Listeria/Bacterioides repeat-containing protein [Nocardioides szechwanensis]